MEHLQSPVLVCAVALVAMVYAAVGHGGASGYLAVLALAAVPSGPARTLALAMNLIVAGIGLVQFARAGHFRWGLAWPFMVGSVPLAFVGGALRTSDRLYDVLLGLALAAAAARFLIRFPTVEASDVRTPAKPTAGAIGAGIGLLSGIVGIGGGVFLSPVMLFARWADAKSTAATAAGFIVANSLAGLLGQRSQGPLDLHLVWPLLAAGVVGGLIGAHLGSRRLPNAALQRALCIVLLIAAAKAILVQ